MLLFANRLALSPYLHPKALLYVDEMLEPHEVIVKITKARNSKFGDYRLPIKHQYHQITVNGNLNRHAFLLTLIHEIAHLKAFHIYGRNILPHGKEWKSCFKQLMKPLLRLDFFPAEVLPSLVNYMQNPKASSASDLKLFDVLHHSKNKADNGMVKLSDIPENAWFLLRDRSFKKLEKRRTRILCEELNSGKKYLIHSLAEVTLIEQQ